LDHLVTKLLNVVFVALEERLVSSQHNDILFHLFGGIFIQTLLIQRWSDIRFKCGLVLFISNALPVHIFQPNVTLHFFWSVQPKSISWFTLKSFVDEISCFHAPAFW
jgi:hypothetical protein